MICKSHYNIRKKANQKMIEEQNKKWLNPRLYFIQSLLCTESYRFCPECGTEVTYPDEDMCEAYCPNCGLVVTANIEYVAGFKINFPFGRKP